MKPFLLDKVWISLKQRLFVSGPVRIGARFHIGMLSYVSSPHELVIGDDVYIGKFCSIQCSGRIGDGVLIANNVGVIGRRDHDMRAVGVPIRLAPSVADTSQLAKDPRNAVDIGPDVWIGFGATVLSGVRIGRGAIVAAGAVVIDDVAPYDIVSGNPARTVSRRFSEQQISEHEAGMAQGDR